MLGYRDKMTDCRGRVQVRPAPRQQHSTEGCRCRDGGPGQAPGVRIRISGGHQTLRQCALSLAEDTGCATCVAAIDWGLRCQGMYPCKCRLRVVGSIHAPAYQYWITSADIRSGRGA